MSKASEFLQKTDEQMSVEAQTALKLKRELESHIKKLSALVKQYRSASTRFKKVNIDLPKSQMEPILDIIDKSNKELDSLSKDMVDLKSKSMFLRDKI